MGKEYHVAITGLDSNTGEKDAPFRTINRAAAVALAGDKVIVHGGTYRECVNPVYGGRNDSERICYEAAPGEKVLIRGSEIVRDWEQCESGVWKTVIKNEFFGDFNPFATKLMGDWVVDPYERPAHLGDVYLNGVSLFEAYSYEEVLHPVKWEKSVYVTWFDKPEPVTYPERSLCRWFAEVNDTETIIYANFNGADPRCERVEISVRMCCFYPKKTGVNYITLRGFDIGMAATPWAPPTSDQIGMIGTHWSKGWIIENNDIHDSKCSGISLGKEVSTGDNDFTRTKRKPGYQYQLEAAFKAKNIGWDKEKIGSHIIRNNKIHDCGQTGIVGNLGCIFSEIYGNEICHISDKHEFYGHELGGIKFHAAIDVYIHHNYFHHCSLGTWLDWEAQGIRVSSNIYIHNSRDLMIEVTHGPAVLDHNIFGDDFALVNAAQGTAFVQNLICGYMQHYDVRNRSTPYHLPHSTDMLGCAIIYGDDDRHYKNIYVGGDPDSTEKYGTRDYNGCPASLEEYTSFIHIDGKEDERLYETLRQPVGIDGNVYMSGAAAYDKEKHNIISPKLAHFGIRDEADGVYLDLTLCEEFEELMSEAVTSDLLGTTRLSEERFEERDGSSYCFDTDMLGDTAEGNFVAGPLHTLKAGENHIKIWKHI